MSTIDTEAYPSVGAVNNSIAGLNSQSKLRPKSLPSAPARAAKSEQAQEGGDGEALAFVFPLLVSAGDAVVA